MTSNYHLKIVQGVLQLRDIVRRRAWRELPGWIRRASGAVMWQLSRRGGQTQMVEPLISQFMRNGCIPWTSGYHEYKWESIAKYINADFGSLIGSEKYGYRIDERAVELPWLLSRLDSCGGAMLDAGSALNHSIILQHPKIRAKNLFISTLAYEGIPHPEWGISYVYEDLRQTCFRENFFDSIACISTIEHVGMDNTFLYTSDASKKEQNSDDYLFFLDVLRSRLKPGGRLYMTLPLGKACNRGWFQVFDAAMVDRMIARFQPAESLETIFYYSNDRWRLGSRQEAVEATCFDIHTQTEYEDDYLAFARCVACLELLKP